MRVRTRFRSDILCAFVLIAFVGVVYWLLIGRAFPRFLWSNSPAFQGETEPVGRQVIVTYWLKADHAGLVARADEELSTRDGANITSRWRRSDQPGGTMFSRGVSAGSFDIDGERVEVSSGPDEAFVLLNGKAEPSGIGAWRLTPAPGWSTVLHMRDKRPPSLWDRLGGLRNSP